MMRNLSPNTRAGTKNKMTSRLKSILGRTAGLRFLTRLGTDVRGNALVIAAAGFIPMAALIGGGLDVARAHMAKSRLQQACDAGALAGRRAMSGSQFTDAAREEALKFFNFNFPQNTYSTASFDPVIEQVDNGTVRISAETTIPTTIMAVFGYSSIDLGVDCEATNELVNTDIMLVLDVTGSMDESINGTRKISSLRDAVMVLYEELEPTQQRLEDAGLRLRYGVLPYSQTVNVGRLLKAEHPQYITQRATYFACDAWGCREVEKNVDAVVNSKDGKGGGGQNQGRGPWEGCIQERKTINSIGPGSPSSVPAGAWDLNIDMMPQPSDEQSSWSPYLPEEYRYVYNGRTYKFPSACPVQARHLVKMEESDLQTAVDELTPVGGTYHDIGMIWGTRMISDGGVFGHRNPLEFNGFPVQKHIIFMTDGLMCPDGLAYSAYGVEAGQRRVTASGAGLGTNCTDPNNYSTYQKTHSRRFEIVCNEAKALGVAVWIVSFEAPLTDSLARCADPGRAFMASDEAELIEQFRNIGRSIAALRITE